MSRDDGFAIADVDPAYFDDPKVRRLVRSTRDEGLIARCLVAHTALVLASWRTGKRVMLEDAVPTWLSSLDDITERLVAAGLIDDDGRIPEHSWEAWFGPARDRREAAREAGREGNRRRWGRDPSGSVSGPDRDPTGTQSPSVPSVPSVPSLPTGYPQDPIATRSGPDKRDRANGHDETTCPGCGDALLPVDPNVRADPRGQLWHIACPTAMAAVTA